MYLYFKLVLLFNKIKNENSEKIISKNKKIAFDLQYTPLLDSEFNLDQIELSIIIPAYNEEKRLLKTISKIIYYFESIYRLKGEKIKYEVIIVDAGSDDKTWTLIEQIIDLFSNTDILGIKISHNLGKGHTILNGVKYSRGKYILLMDADNAGNIKEYRYLREEFDKLKYDLPYNDNLNDEHDIKRYKPKPGIVIASRFQRNRYWVRKYLSILNTIIINFIFNFDKISDSQCGFKLFTRESARKIFPKIHLMKWAYDVEIIILARLNDIKVKSKKIIWKEKEGSKLNVFYACLLFLRDYIFLIHLYRLDYFKNSKNKFLINEKYAENSENNKKEYLYLKKHTKRMTF